MSIRTKIVLAATLVYFAPQEVRGNMVSTYGPYCVCVESWEMDVPTTVFGIDKFGIRRGDFSLHIAKDSADADVPINLRDITESRHATGPFARWNTEDELFKIARSSRTRPLMITFQPYSDGVRIIDIKLLSSRPDHRTAPLKSSATEDEERAWRFLLERGARTKTMDSLFVDPESLILFAVLILVSVPLPTYYLLKKLLPHRNTKLK